MDMFKWVGRRKREEGWMKEPRRVPDFAQKLSADESSRFVMSREFVNDEDKNKRVYMAAWQEDPKSPVWDIVQVTSDFKYAGYCNTSTQAYQVRDPMAVVKALCDFERLYKANAAYIPHEDQRPTYRPFANQFGIHFDDDGKAFRVGKETPLATDTFMNRESLDKLFHKDVPKTVPLDTWAGLYEGLVNRVAPEWTVTDRIFDVPGPVEGALKVEAAARQYDSEDWTPPAAPAAEAPKPLSPDEVNKAFDGLKAAFKKAAAADTGAAQPAFGKLRDQFISMLDETTRRSGKPTAEVIAGIVPLINSLTGTAGDLQSAAMKDNRAMDALNALVSDIEYETRSLQGTLPRNFQSPLAKARVEGVVLPPSAKPASPETTPASVDSTPTASEVKPAASDSTPAASGTTPAAPPAAPEVPVTINGKTFAEMAKERSFAVYRQMGKIVITRPVTHADVASDPSYAEYGAVTGKMIAQLKEMPAALLGKGPAPTEGWSDKLEYFVRGSFVEGREKLAQHEAAATILVGLLRTGVEVYNEQFGPGKKFTPQGLQMVARIGELCEKIAVRHLGVEEAEAKKISKIITQGKDPFGPELPLEKLFAKFPPPPYKPPAAPPASNARTKPATPRHGW